MEYNSTNYLTYKLFQSEIIWNEIYKANLE